MDDIKTLTAQLAKPGSVDAVDLEAAGNALGIRWPDDYRSYMLEAGGGEGSVGEGYLALWAASDIVETNGPTVQAFEPQFVGIGTNGGGELFAYDTSQETPRIVMTPLVDLMPTSWVEIGSFHDLLVRLAEDRLFEPRDIEQRRPRRTVKWMGPALVLSLAVAMALVGLWMGPFERSGRLSAIAPLVAAGLAAFAVYLVARARRSSRDIHQR